MKTHVLQASSNTTLSGWQNTKFASVNLSELEREFIKLASDPKRWIGGKIGELRIVTADVADDTNKINFALR